MEQGSWVEYHPLTMVSDGSSIEFDVSSTGDDYIDFANTMLYVKAKVTQDNGNNLAADAEVGPVNLFLHSLFSQVDISLNGILITSSTNTYPYRAMLETLLSYGEDAKTSQLTSALYYKDIAGKMDSIDFAAANVNSGLGTRRNLACESRVIDMMGRIHADIFFQDRYMLNEVGVKIKLIRSNSAFCLMGDAAYKVKITHASLFVRKVKLMPSVFLAHAKALERGTAKYPIRRVVCKSFTIPQNYRDLSHEKLFLGQLPTRMVIGLVDNRQQQHAVRPIQPDFTNGQYIRAYNTVFAGTGKLNADEGLFIDRSDYGSGYALYAFDLTADLGEDDHFSLVREGSVRLALKFSAALANTVMVIAYAEFENVIKIDRNRNVVFDFRV